jgi:hypothetical protein
MSASFDCQGVGKERASASRARRRSNASTSAEGTSILVLAIFGTLLLVPVCTACVFVVGPCVGCEEDGPPPNTSRNEKTELLTLYGKYQDLVRSSPDLRLYGTNCEDTVVRTGPPPSTPKNEQPFLSILIQATRKRDPYSVIGEFGGGGVVVRVGEVGLDPHEA